jgi:zinc protease
MLEQRFTNQNSSYLSRSIAMARAEASPAGLRAAVDYVGRVRAVRAEDVQRAAAKYLSLQTTSIHELEPLTAPARTFDSARFSATLAAWAPQFSKPVAPASVHPADARQSLAPVAQGAERPKQQQLAVESMEALPVKDFSTLNGPRAYVREDHSVPQVTLVLLFQGGRIIEDQNNAGITELMLRSMIYGTARRSYTQLTDELEQLGAKLEPVVEPDFFGFTLSVLSRNAEQVLRILRDIVEEPSFNDDDVKRAAICQIGLIRAERNSALCRARELLMEALFAPHGYSTPLHGREESVAKLTADQLRAWHQQSVLRQLPFVFIVGDTDGSALVSGEIASGFRRRDLDRSLQVRIPQARLASEKAEQGGGGLAALALGFAGPRSTSVDRMPLALACEALNGPGGLLNVELRDKQGLAVDAFCTDEVMFSVGAIWVGALTVPENEARAKAALASELQQVARQGLSADQLEAAKAAALGSRIAALQFQNARAIEYARAAVYQQAAADVDNYYERASKVTANEIKRVASTYFKTPSYGIVHGRPSTASSGSKQN